MVFFLKRVHDRIDQVDQNVKSSFEHVKRDNENLYAWIQYLHEQSTAQKQELVRKAELVEDHESQLAMQNRLIREMKQELEVVPKSKEEIKALVDEAYSFDPIIDRIKRVENRIDHLESGRVSTQKQPQIPTQKPISALKEKVLKRIAKNSKEYIKSVVIGIIRKYEKISAMELREIVIEEQGLCSKSSFYRILEELEAEDVMNLVSRGKEKVYISTQK